MFDKKILIIYLFIINIIISLGMTTNVWAVAQGIYTKPALAFDVYRTIWVFVGTGDKTDPKGVAASDMLLGIKDDDRTSTYTLASLQNVTSLTSCPTNTHGWYWALSGTERCMEDALVSNGRVYFATYIPPAITTGCGNAGESYMHTMDYQTGCNAEVYDLGAGMAGGAQASVNPADGTTGIYYGVGGTIKRYPDDNPGNVSGHPIYWRDMRLQ